LVAEALVFALLSVMTLAWLGRDRLLPVAAPAVWRTRRRLGPPRRPFGKIGQELASGR
jgi:hypothetical protein